MLLIWWTFTLRPKRAIRTSPAAATRRRMSTVGSVSTSSASSRGKCFPFREILAQRSYRFSILSFRAHLPQSTTPP